MSDGDSRSGLVRSVSGWSESVTNKHPRVYACRGDYAVYYLLQHLSYGTNMTTTLPAITSAVQDLIHSLATFDRAYYGAFGQW